MRTGQTMISSMNVIACFSFAPSTPYICRKVLNVKASNRAPNAKLYVRVAKLNMAGMAWRNCCSLYDDLTRDSNKNRDVAANDNPITYVYDKALNMGESPAFGSSVWEKEELMAKTTAATALVHVFAIPTS